MAGCFSNTPIDRYLEKQVDDYYDELDAKEEDSAVNDEDEDEDNRPIKYGI